MAAAIRRDSTRQHAADQSRGMWRSATEQYRDPRQKEGVSDMPFFRNAIILTFLTAAVWALRLPFAGVYAESWDAVDFALALQRYDIFNMQPHFPGYPLYILAGHLFLPFAEEPVRALTLLSVWCGALSQIPFYLLAQKLLPDARSRWTAMLLFAASPLLGLTVVQPMSDAFGLLAVLVLLAVIAATLHLSGRPLFLLTCLAAVWFALLLGIRLSSFPFGFLLLHPLFRLFRERRSLGGFIARTAVVVLLFLAALAGWLLPTAATEGGLVPFWQLGQAFTVGHFTDWGGTSFSSGASWGERLYGFLWERLTLNGLIGTSEEAFAQGLTGWLNVPVLAVLIGGAAAGAADLLRRRPQPAVVWFLALAAGPYALWAFFGQNSEKARHILPLLPLLLLLVAHGFSVLGNRPRRFAGKAAVCMLFAGVLAVLTVRQAAVLQRHLDPPPALQLVRFVESRYPPEGTLLYTWEEERLFDYYAPAYETERVRRFAYFAQSLTLHASTVSRVLVTNAVLDGFPPELRPAAKEVARFSADPFLYPTYHTVILYELPTQGAQQPTDGSRRRPPALPNG